MLDLFARDKVSHEKVSAIVTRPYIESTFWVARNQARFYGKFYSSMPIRWARKMMILLRS